jgi:Ca2+-transporting ATPase
MWQHIVWLGLFIAALSLGTQAYAIASGSEHWQTMTFTVLTLCQLVHAQVVRSEAESLFALGIRGNLPLLGAVFLTVGLQMLVIYTPTGNLIFKTTPLPAEELSICLVLPFLVLVASEIEKRAIRRFSLFGFTRAQTPQNK